MRQVYLLISSLAIVFGLIACGKFADKFSRLHNNSGYTIVNFSPDQSFYEPAAAQSGGVMIYVMNQAAGGQGLVLGFSNETLANSSTVAIPNGTYKIYALGYEGASAGGGQVRCGYGSGGASVTFNGTAATVPINIAMANCSFGNATVFSHAANGDASSVNFDNWTINLCSSGPYPSCTNATSSTHGVKVTLMAGTGGGNSVTTENTAQSITSICQASTAGVFTFGSNFTAPFATGFAMPVKIQFYADSSCSTSIVRTFSFTDGLKNYLSGTTGSTTYVYSPATTSTTYVDLYMDF